MHECASHSEQREVGNVKKKEGEDSGQGWAEGTGKAKASTKEAEKVHGGGGGNSKMGDKPKEGWRGEEGGRKGKRGVSREGGSCRQQTIVTIEAWQLKEAGWSANAKMAMVATCVYKEWKATAYVRQTERRKSVLTRCTSTPHILTPHF